MVFSESVTGFDGTDVTFTGTAGANTATVTGSGTHVQRRRLGHDPHGHRQPAIAAGRAADAAGNTNTAATSTDNTVTYDITPPTVTINQASGQADPTSASPINFTVVFSESVTGFDGTDITFAGTAGATTATVTGGPSTYTVAISGMTGSGTVQPSIAAGRAADLAGNANTASTSTDNTVTYDITAPTVTINQASGQADPTSASPVNFTVVFSESVTGFDGTDITFTGTAGATTATVTGSGTTYNVAISGMTLTGTVQPTIAAGRAADAAGNTNLAATNTDNTVSYVDTTPPTVTINQAAGQADPTSTSPISYTVVFSESVTGFDGTDFTFSGTAPGSRTATVTGGPSTYTVAITGMTGSGTVQPSIAAGRAADLAGNSNIASTSTDNTVTYSDTTAPIVTITSFAVASGSTVTATGTGGTTPGDNPASP